ncbi:hypothetical protein LSAT2_003252 [Lamellibrachia satsuma]|nr:hypothetical protein LSAT2_003252 [Lamellibrachia satsuma]
MDVAHETSLMFWLVLVFTFGTQVVTTDDNIAVGHPARQSSVQSGGTADKAVDGNTNGDFETGQSCVHTSSANRNNPWWAVDLLSECLVRSVQIYNRVDHKPHRLHDLRVGLVDTWPESGESSLIAMDAICAIIDGTHPEARVDAQCEKNAIGRYLVIQIDGDNSVLAICEVNVFATKRAVNVFELMTRNLKESTTEHHGRYTTPDRGTPRLMQKKPRNTTTVTPCQTMEHHGRYTTPDHNTQRQIIHGKPRNTIADTPRQIAEHHGRYKRSGSGDARTLRKGHILDQTAIHHARYTMPDRETPHRYTTPDRKTPRQIIHCSPRNTMPHRGTPRQIHFPRPQNITADTSRQTAEHHSRYTKTERETPRLIHHARQQNTMIDTFRQTAKHYGRYISPNFGTPRQTTPHARRKTAQQIHHARPRNNMPDTPRQTAAHKNRLR